MTLNPLVQKFVEGQLPEAMVPALLGGALPVPPLDLLHALAHAVFQETPHKDKALESLGSLPESLLHSAIIGPVDPPAPLGLICMFRKEPALLETALLHESLDAAWMERVVPSLPGSVLDIVSNNQVLWIERPGILDALEAHPEGEYNLKRRINEFRRDVLHQLDEATTQERLEIISEVEAGTLDKAWAELPPPKPDEVEEELPEVIKERYSKPILDDEGKEVPLRLAQRLLKLGTSQKIMLAIKGGKEERTALIRESNRLIQVGVIRNARITEGEVAYIAQMRNINDEVLRIISMNREWMKKYAVVRALVFNPRTPPSLSLTFFKRLMDSDIKFLMKDKNVSEVLRREAKRFLESKSAGK